MTRDIDGADASRSCDAIATATGKGPAAAKPLLDPSAKRRVLLVALIAGAAAVTGATAGALAAAGLARPATEIPEPALVATIYETRLLQGAITVLRDDLAALKSSVQADAEVTNAQLTKLGDRFDRADRLRAPRETTGTVRRCRSAAKDGSCLASAMARPSIARPSKAAASSPRTAPPAAARAPQRGGIF